MTPQCDACGSDAAVSAAGWGCGCCGKYVAGDLSPAGFLATLDEDQRGVLYHAGFGGAGGITRTSMLFGQNPFAPGCESYAWFEAMGVDEYRARYGGPPAFMRKRLTPQTKH